MLRVSGVLLVVWATAMTAGAQRPIHIEAGDGLVSVEADRVGLGALLRELDRVAGTTSDVPLELQSRSVSVAFSLVPLDEGIDRLFAGLAIDYAVVGGNRIVVLAASQQVRPAPPSRPVAQGAPTPVPQPAATATFTLPGFQPGNFHGVDDAITGRGVRGFGQLRQVEPNGPVTNPSLPGLGTALPFGVVPDRPGAASVSQPAPAFIGNTSPAILDLNQSQTAPTGPPAPATAPALPPPPSNP